MDKERILIIEDEPEWVEIVRHWLKLAGYENVESAALGSEGIELAVRNPPDCILLDLVLPDQSGTEVCGKLRSMPALSRVPVVLFTGHKKEKVLGLQSGADYFVAKSERPHELLATLQAVFRRKETEAGLLRHGEIVLRAQERQVECKGARVATLTPKMFTLFHVLVERSPQPVSRADLYRLVEGVEEPGASRALDVMLNRLRKALPTDVAARIINVKNFGYVFVDVAPPASIPKPKPAL